MFVVSFYTFFSLVVHVHPVTSQLEGRCGRNNMAVGSTSTYAVIHHYCDFLRVPLFPPPITLTTTI